MQSELFFERTGPGKRRVSPSNTLAAIHGTWDGFRANRAATDAKMAEKKKQPTPLKRRPVGDRRQFLTMMSPDLIKSIKLAAIEDDRPAWDVMEEAARRWLEWRKSAKKI